MPRIERGQRLHGPRQHRERARIAFAIARRLLQAGKAHLDLADLLLGRAHHARDDTDPLFFRNAPPRRPPPRVFGNVGHVMNSRWDAKELNIVMPALDAGIPLRDALCPPQRDGRGIRRQRRRVQRRGRRAWCGRP